MLEMDLLRKCSTCQNDVSQAASSNILFGRHFAAVTLPTGQKARTKGVCKRFGEI